MRLVLEGHVQGVGFRPFVYRLALGHGITGHVRNCVGRVEILACGPAHALAAFRADLIRRAPGLSRPRLTRCERAATIEGGDFAILPSVIDDAARVFVPADNYLCEDCRRELTNPADRRYRYPFINCTQCGPRYTLIEALPYDRVNTSMAGFPLCPDCRAEYEEPGDRRYHAEPIACAVCGPQLCWHVPGSETYCEGVAALDAAVDRLRDGSIVAVKGVGGYHLLCDATNELAIARLRKRKRRPHKPLAIMLPHSGADGLDLLRRIADVTADELECLLGPARPVTLVRERADSGLPRNIAPGLVELGVILPYSPLHELLLGDLGRPLIATSANISGEPVLTDAAEVEARLGEVADAFLHHDRPIVRPADDAVFRRVGRKPRPLRLGRGTAPLELDMPWAQAVPLIALGGQMKSTITLSWGRRAVVSPHIGDMDSPHGLEVLQRIVVELQSLYGVRAERLACDAHPTYTTHRWARTQALPVTPVTHHYAHAGALTAEAGGGQGWLVFTWDGVGLGPDGTLWGGEALFGAAGRWRRVASFRPFRQPGGDVAGRQPWRSAAALHWACGLTWHDAPAEVEVELVEIAHRRGLNSPWTSAAGRLFDAAAAMLTGKYTVSYEAEGPMRLEALCDTVAEPVPLPLAVDTQGLWRSDWAPLLPMLADRRRSVAERSAVFHSSMARVIVDQARRISREFDVRRVGLCGGVFQNRVLAGLALDGLATAGFDAVLPERLPCNDAALSFGQAAEVAALG